MLNFRNAEKTDVQLYFNWANDTEVRKNSYQTIAISYENHVNWFENKLLSNKALLLVFENELHRPVGQVRFEFNDNNAVVGISIDKNYRGKGYAVEMIEKANSHYFSLYPTNGVIAYIKKDNFASYKSFVTAGFELLEEVEESGVPSYKLIKKNVPLPK